MKYRLYDRFLRLTSGALQSKFSSSSTLLRQLVALKPQLATAAQKVYDRWDASDPDYGDWEVGSGGICHLIADAMLEVVTSSMPDLVGTTISSNFEVHVFVVVGKTTELEGELEEEYYSIDIPPYVYETGGGYSWKKIPGVVFEAADVVIETAEPLELDENGDVREIY